jgi:hypothetical protein
MRLQVNTAIGLIAMTTSEGIGERVDAWGFSNAVGDILNAFAAGP